MPTLIHQRVRSATAGTNPTVIRRMPPRVGSVGDVQTLRGYCLLLSDPVVRDINVLDAEARAIFLRDMVIVGDGNIIATRASTCPFDLARVWPLMDHIRVGIGRRMTNGSSRWETNQ